jgi:hypothetical protein
MAPSGARAKLAVAAAALSLAGQALAAGDNGFKVGDGRLHLYFDLQGEYNSNVLYTTSRVPDLILHFRPGLMLNVPGRDVALDLSGNVSWNQYLGVSNSGTKDLSFLSAAADLTLGFNRGGTVGLELADSFQRSNQITSLSLASAAITNNNVLRLAVPVRPGGGALEFKIGGQWQVQSFEPFLSAGATCDPVANPSCNPANLSLYGYNQLTGAAEVRWFFLPRTALLLQGSYFARIPNDETVSLPISGYRVWAGAAGLVTPHLAGTLKGGYGNSLGSAGVPFGTWLLNAEAEYLITGGIGVKLGYLHDYQADVGTVYSLYAFHRIYLEGKVPLVSHFTVRGGGQLEWDQYVLIDQPTQVANANLWFDWEVIRYVILSAGYQFTWRTSTVPAGPVPPVYSYNVNQVFLQARFIY